MFGFDWDGDGEEGFFDDMMTIHMIEEAENEDSGYGNGGGSGSCLMFLLAMGAVAATPIILAVNFLT